MLRKPRFLPDLPEEPLAKLQLSGIRWTIDHAMNTAQYRAKLHAAGIRAGADIKSLDDVQRLPFTTAEDLRDGYPLPLLCVPPREVVRIHSSSGTTGKRKILAYTRRDLDSFSLQMARCFELSGMTEDDRLQVAVGYGLWTAGAAFQLGSERFGSMTIPVGAGNLDLHLQMLKDMGTTVIGATASMALLLAEEVERHHLRGKLALRKVIFGAEPHSLKMRRTFEEKLGIEGSYDIGGMTEMYGPGTSLDCDAQEGLHYWADMFYYEIINPDTLERVPDGTVGELVVTSLCKEATPLIRYRTRDLTWLIPGKCSCGRNIPRHGRILGRSDDMIIYRAVNIYPGQLVEVLHQFPEVGGEYHINLTRQDSKDYMTMQVERSVGATSDNDIQLSQRISNALHDKIMARINVEIVNPGTLPRTFSKAKRVTDLRLE